MTRRAQPLDQLQVTYGKAMYPAGRWLGFPADGGDCRRVVVLHFNVVDYTFSICSRSSYLVYISHYFYSV